MSPLFFMLALLALLHLSARSRWAGATLWAKAACAMGLSLAVAAAMHFVRPDLFLPMVPAFLPAPELIVLVSGVVELAVAVGLLVPRTRRLAGWAAVVLFVSIWPGSIYVALSGNYPEQPTSSPLYHWLRVPFHAIYVGWALWIARGGRAEVRSLATTAQ